MFGCLDRFVTTFPIDGHTHEWSIYVCMLTWISDIYMIGRKFNRIHILLYSSVRKILFCLFVCAVWLSQAVLRIEEQYVCYLLLSYRNSCLVHRCAKLSYDFRRSLRIHKYLHMRSSSLTFIPLNKKREKEEKKDTEQTNTQRLIHGRMKACSLAVSLHEHVCIITFL